MQSFGVRETRDVGFADHLDEQRLDIPARLIAIRGKFRPVLGSALGQREKIRDRPAGFRHTAIRPVQE